MDVHIPNQPAPSFTPPKTYTTRVPINHPGVSILRNVIINDPSMDPEKKKDLERQIEELVSKQDFATYTTTGPLSISGNKIFVRPQLEHMEPLVVALGLGEEGGWKEVWKTMHPNRKRLCELVRDVLEISPRIKGTDGNTYEVSSNPSSSAFPPR
ncbi:hypothetical protein BDY24DRAFT_208794 [Mrakia frigida]|uniref:uncharacterized protein n=1 Tax=Mrakia frigida TaxID=29902 RepID=UPI003FCBEFB8